MPDTINNFQYNQLNALNNEFNAIKSTLKLNNNLNLFAIINLNSDERKMILLDDALKLEILKSNDISVENNNSFKQM